MTVPHDTAFVYRFDVPADRIYGPATLEWIGEAHGSRPECQCAPADASGTQPAGPWRPVQTWLADMLPAPATDRQIKRLTKLQIPHDPNTLTRDEARRLLAEAEGRLHPTKSQLKKAAELKLAVPVSATRAELEDLIDAEEHKAAIASLRRRKIEIADDASWEEIGATEEAAEERKEALKLAAALRKKGVAASDNLTLGELDELDYALRELRSAIREAKKLGLAFEPPSNLTLAQIQQLSSALFQLEELMGRAEANLGWYVDARRLPREPSRGQIQAALPALFERLLSESWGGTEDDEVWFFQRALDSGVID